ncbi:hypothetical protein [Nitrososphaera sp.]|uniref:hypothetical protein n=1 Tax=Nitrososphaera sp. TaxID=1971748 RepID=UPI0018216777|nr:hypothetical protein [Nitrososphaera sp.]NWG38245.1 hypothetical protein [Nitrososphaera sp.]
MDDSRIWAHEFVKQVSKRNVDYLLGLFDDEATVYEPFSATGTVSGRVELESFLKVFCKYTSAVVDMKSVRVSTMGGVPYSATAAVTLGKGARSKLVFEFNLAKSPPSQGNDNLRVKKLKISL